MDKRIWGFRLNYYDGWSNSMSDMKTREQITEARNVIAKWMDSDTPNEEQKIMLWGLSVALQWVSNEGGNTVQMLVDGRQIQRYEIPSQVRF